MLTDEQEKQALSIARYDVHAAYLYWQVMLEKNATPDAWNTSDFGVIPFKMDGRQATIFLEEVDEPPDPVDYSCLSEYLCAWDNWQEKNLRKSPQV
jgi:hypothetical protein